MKTSYHGIQLFLDGIQRGRLVDLLEEDVEDYGIRETAKRISDDARRIKFLPKYLLDIINETNTRIDILEADWICKCLAINPNYVYHGRGTPFLQDSNNYKPIK